eukprot:2340854-Amphidinium_carterae.1
MMDIEVGKLDVKGVARLAEEVLSSKGLLRGDEREEKSAIGKTVKVLRQNDITGPALLKVTTEELMLAGMALGPANSKDVGGAHCNIASPSTSSTKPGVWAFKGYGP